MQNRSRYSQERACRSFLTTFFRASNSSRRTLAVRSYSRLGALQRREEPREHAAAAAAQQGRLSRSARVLGSSKLTAGFVTPPEGAIILVKFAMTLPVFCDDMLFRYVMLACCAGILSLYLVAVVEAERAHSLASLRASHIKNLQKSSLLHNSNISDNIVK